MDINRNQIFMAGMVLLLFGVQFRALESAVLTPRATKFLAEQSDHPAASVTRTMDSLTGNETTLPRKTIRPPDWLGYFCLSMGAFLILHSWTMAKPA